jgi:hypothetical protein
VAAISNNLQVCRRSCSHSRVKPFCFCLRLLISCNQNTFFLIVEHQVVPTLFFVLKVCTCSFPLLRRPFPNSPARCLSIAAPRPIRRPFSNFPTRCLSCSPADVGFFTVDVHTAISHLERRRSTSSDRASAIMPSPTVCCPLLRSHRKALLSASQFVLHFKTIDWVRFLLKVRP